MLPEEYIAKFIYFKTNQPRGIIPLQKAENQSWVQ